MKRIEDFWVDIEHSFGSQSWRFSETPPDDAETYNAKTHQHRPAEVRAIVYTDNPFAPQGEPR